jgi:hypothetical protein
MILHPGHEHLSSRTCGHPEASALKKGVLSQE